MYTQNRYGNTFVISCHERWRQADSQCCLNHLSVLIGTFQAKERSTLLQKIYNIQRPISSVVLRFPLLHTHTFPYTHTPNPAHTHTYPCTHTPTLAHTHLHMNIHRRQTIKQKLQVFLKFRTTNEYYFHNF